MMGCWQGYIRNRFCSFGSYPWHHAAHVGTPCSGARVTKDTWWPTFLGLSGCNVTGDRAVSCFHVGTSVAKTKNISVRLRMYLERSSPLHAMKFIAQ